MKKPIILLGIGYILYWLFTSDVQGEKFEKYVAAYAPADQHVFLDIIGSAIAEADAAANDAAAATAFINANGTLCGDQVFHGLAPHHNWVGLFEDADATDAGDKIYVELFVGFGNSVRAEVAPNAWPAILTMKRNDPVMFSGKFKYGNMLENQCIRTTWSAVFGSSPDLEDRTFLFSLTDIKVVPTIE
ncbi:hypothetical protein GFB49_17530 [Epibacterium sp. SM1979]|uniref:Uncharacterized protein n=1 Tax=Tritonibacter litoralis TaxID=2662264 RepID=A0A843YLZ6_9RHOB|nr:hypothetical protein [Tritonibacter litoralis]MQQ10272.1 hypothetical protein [Tritonibacter litoralis]